ncbi:DUF485 domain-containing protein [Nonomuraea rhodomycinica]|uniref:DUF485 domain-containing protein n=1 Tax=Nonomuraea rhodomycinica TaxID=1712872 RepID=A0A7Y6IZ34_9ACTN|nr:DUF485 domain-containing protein [Nonomuraea rhodomycinica]
MGPFTASAAHLVAIRKRLGERAGRGPPLRVGCAPTVCVTRITVEVSVTTQEHDASVYEQVQTSSEFQDLKRRFRRWTFPMTVAFLAWYLLYVVLSGFARDFMGIKLFGNVNVALVLGLLQFVSTFWIAWAYARHAEKKLDPIADKLRHEVEEKTR